jgi:WD40 repeat protein
LNEIKTREIFLIILSPDAIGSKWVDIEITIAWQQKLSQAGSTKRIIPILYRPCEIRDDLNTLQIVSFISPRTYTEAFDQLLLALQSSPAMLTRQAQTIITIREEPLFVWDILPESSIVAPSDKSVFPTTRLFYGRQEEINKLKHHIVNDRSRIMAILGMGGMGKTSLAAALTKQLDNTFDALIWCSLRSAPPLEDVLKKCVLLLSNQELIALPQGTNKQIILLLQYLTQKRCLIILDNIESVLQSEKRVGQYQEGYEDYGVFLQRIGESPHRSCLLLTSREMPNEIAYLEGTTEYVHSLKLSGLEQRDIQEILKEKELFGSEETWRSLTTLHSGNPLALKLVAEPIRTLFDGDIAAFLKEDAGIVQNIRALLAQQFQRLSPIEQEIMYWLAIEQEKTSLDTLKKDIVHNTSKRDLFEALGSLRRRAMIELNTPGYFTLLPVISEYIIGTLIEQIAQEIQQESPKILGTYALIKAQTKDYVRETQARLILTPLSDWLFTFLNRETLEQNLKRILTDLHEQPSQILHYTAGNICNLLIHLNYDLRGYDFSHLTLRQVYLQGALLPNVNFEYSNLTQSVFTENFGSVLTVAFSPDGNLLAGGTADGEVRLWAVSTGTLLQTFTGHTDRIWSVIFHPGGSLFASSSEDETIRFWDVDTGSCVKTLYGHTSWIRSIAFSPDGTLLASASADKTIRLWDTSTGDIHSILQGHTDWARSVAFSSDGCLLASSSEDRTIRLWNIATGSELKILRGHTDRVWCVAFQPDGKLLASSSEDKTIRLWNIEGGDTTNILQGHTDRVRCVVFSPDGKILASGSENYNIRLWDVSTGQCIRTLQAYTDRIWSITFSKDGKYIASGSMDQTVRLWDVTTGQCLKTFQGYIPNRIWSIAFSPNGQLLASGGMDRIVRLWDMSSNQCIKSLQGHFNHIKSVAFSPNGQLLASGSMDRIIRLWDVTTGRNVHTLRGHSSWIWSIAFSPDGKILASGSVDQTIRLWEVSTGRNLSVLQGHTHHIRPLVFHPNGSIIASGSDDQTIRIWDITTAKCLHVLQGHTTKRIWSLGFSPDGQTLVSGSEDHTIRFWDLATQTCQTILQGHTKPVMCLCFSPDGQTLVSGSEDHTIRFWDLATQTCQTILQGHTKPVMCLCFSPDGQILVSGGDDGEIQFWNVQDKTCLHILKSEKPYEKMNIAGVTNLTDAQKLMLKDLGAIETE